MRSSHTHPRVNWLRQCGSEGATSSAGRINYHHTAARNLSRELEGGTAPLQGSTGGNGQSGVGQGCAGKPGGGYWPAAPPRHRTIALARKKTVGPENHRPRNVGRPGGGVRPHPWMGGQLPNRRLYGVSGIPTALGVGSHCGRWGIWRTVRWQQEMERCGGRGETLPGNDSLSWLHMRMCISFRCGGGLEGLSHLAGRVCGQALLG